MYDLLGVILDNGDIIALIALLTAIQAGFNAVFMTMLDGETRRKVSKVSEQFAAIERSSFFVEKTAISASNALQVVEEMVETDRLILRHLLAKTEALTPAQLDVLETTLGADFIKAERATQTLILFSHGDGQDDRWIQRRRGALHQLVESLGNWETLRVLQELRQHETELSVELKDGINALQRRLTGDE
jgi:hypothetical protein